MHPKVSPAEYFDRIEKLRLAADRQRGYSEYGSRVMPVLEMYKELSRYEERRAFQDALEMFLSDDDRERRCFGVDVCLSFFVFRDAI